MKRILFTLLLFVLSIMVVFPVSAEELIDLSDEKLISMYHEIQSILLSRTGNYEIQLSAGKYTIGEDIPSGSYRIEAKGAYSATTLEFYENSEDRYPSNTYIMAELYNSSVIGKLDLRDGNILDITGGAVSISSYNVAQIQLENDKPAQPADTDLPDAETVDSLVVPPGKYQVGPEIPQGTYRVVCEETYGMASFNVFDSQKAIFPSYNTILSPLMGNAEIGKIELKKGQYVEVAEGSVTLYKYTGLGK